MIFYSVHKNEREAMQMEENKGSISTKRACAGVWISRLFVAMALAVTVFTVKTCCPGAVQAAKAWLGFGEEGRAREAFFALKDALSDGDGVAAAFAESYLALAGETP